MMGERRVMQEALFYGFSLERHVPDHHLLREIDRFVDLSELRAHLGPYYSETGRPSIDPELMMRMLIVGYCFGIRSERRLCDEVHLNLAYRWFCPLGLDGGVPDHSTFSKNRHGRFRESDPLRKLFETVVARCMKEGIVGGEAFGVDASMIVADAYRRRGVAKVEDLDPTSSRAVAEYLSVLDDAAFGAATPKEPTSISPTDPAARYTAAADTPAFYAYADNYLVDLKNAVIMDVEATTVVRQAEVGAAKMMIDRTAEKFDLTPSRLVGDAGYGSGEMVAWLVDERGIEPHVKLVDKSERADGTFSRSDFVYDPERDLYGCPGGRELRKYRRAFTKPREGVSKDGRIRYRAIQRDCNACALKPKCCPNDVARKIERSIYEAARDKVRAIAQTEGYAVSRRQRKKVEMLFAHLKRILGLGKLRLRGPSGAKDEFQPPPKICGNWRSSSPSRSQSSPHEAGRRSFAPLTAAPEAHSRRHDTEFFNGIGGERALAKRQETGEEEAFPHDAGNPGLHHSCPCRLPSAALPAACRNMALVKGCLANRLILEVSASCVNG